MLNGETEKESKNIDNFPHQTSAISEEKPLLTYAYLPCVKHEETQKLVVAKEKEQDELFPLRLF